MKKQTTTPISQWPSLEKPREKLIAKGADALSDAELLAIFLRTGIRGKTAVDLARELVNQFGSLANLVKVKQKKFCEIKGLGVAKYAHLQAAIELGRRYLADELKKGDVLTSPQATKNYLLSELRVYSHEVFCCLYLDNRHRAISFEKLFHGTIDSANVYPREVVKHALQHEAAAVIFAHNHPSGVAEPSQADKDITHRLKNALNLLDIRVLDHIIVAGHQTISFAELGIL